MSMEKTEDIKKYVKWIIIAAICIVLYIVIAFSINNSSKVISNDYLLVGDNLIWHKIDNRWYQMTEVTEELLKQKFTLNDGQKNYKVNDIQYSDMKWYFFDKDYKEIEDTSNRIAFSGNLNIKVADYDEGQYVDSDDAIINSVEAGLSDDRLELMRLSLVKYYVDIDADGQDEMIYTFSDNKLDVLDYTPSSYLVLVKNGVVLDYVKTSDSTNLFVVQNILDLDNDKEYELVVSSDDIDYPTFSSCYQIYKIVDDKIKLLQNCLYEK